MRFMVTGVLLVLLSCCLCAQTDQIVDPRLDSFPRNKVKLKESIKKRFSDFHDEKNSWLTFEEIYPLGWSKEGNFAYIIEPEGDRENYYARLIIRDLKSGSILWDHVHYASLEPDEQQRKDFSRITRKAYWLKNRNLFQNKLKQYGIEYSNQIVLRKFPIEEKNDSITPQLEITRDVTKRDLFGNVTRVAIRIESSKRGVQKLYEKQFDLSLGDSYFYDADIFGYFQSPFEPRIAIFVVNIIRGQHGGEGAVNLQIVGTSLEDGFKSEK